MNELLANSLKLEELAERLRDHSDPAVQVFAMKFLADYSDDQKSELEDLVEEKVSELISEVSRDWSRDIAKAVGEWLESR